VFVCDCVRLDGAGGGAALECGEAGAAPLTLRRGGGGLGGAFFCGSLIGRTGKIYEEV
jgi:hypothetical protein